MKRTTDPNPPGAPAVETGGPGGFPEVERRAPLAGLSLVPTKIFFTKGVASRNFPSSSVVVVNPASA